MRCRPNAVACSKTFTACHQIDTVRARLPDERGVESAGAKLPRLSAMERTKASDEDRRLQQ